VRPELRPLVWLGLATLLLAGSAPAAFAASGTATIHWTAPGDDSLTGRATAYDIRYSPTTITASNFLLATQATGVPAPRVAGSAESFAITHLAAGSGYYFAIKSVDDAGNWSPISNVVYYAIGTTAVRIPLTLWLSAPWPNPSSASTHWSYELPGPGPVEIIAFDLAGRRIRSIERGWKEAGQGEAVWDLRDDDGRGVAAGIYLIRTTLGGRTSLSRVSVTR